MPTSDDINRIRAIFLHPEPRVTVAGAAQLLGWSSRRMNEAICDGEIEVAGTCRSSCVEVAELVEMALSLWSMTEIERALESSARKILPPGLRTRTLRTRLPRYLIDMLQHWRRRSGRRWSCSCRASCRTSPARGGKRSRASCLDSPRRSTGHGETTRRRTAETETKGRTDARQNCHRKSRVTTVSPARRTQRVPTVAHRIDRNRRGTDNDSTASRAAKEGHSLAHGFHAAAAAIIETERTRSRSLSARERPVAGAVRLRDRSEILRHGRARETDADAYRACRLG
jgi:hypothetical protein